MDPIILVRSHDWYDQQQGRIQNLSKGQRQTVASAEREPVAGV